MTTLTIITGGAKCGKVMIGAAIANYIRSNYVDNKIGEPIKAMAIGSTTKVKPEALRYDIQDLILVSGTDKIEPWMQEWFKAFGEPLFTIHITRHRE